MSAPVKAAFVKLRIPLVLGSRSPRRIELLESVGLAVTLGASDVDESPLLGEEPHVYVERIARAKLSAACSATENDRQQAVLVADTTVTVDGDILGKPRDRQHASDMLARLVGRTHEVLTCYGLALLGPGSAAVSSHEVVRTVATRVSMRPCSRDVIERYVASEEPLGKAGAYAIQGLGASLVERIEGSYTGVVGLPLCEVLVDLARLGVVEAFE